MHKQYNPAQVEDRIYKQWITHKSFAADEQSQKEAYSIVIPPPNVTGILHMGHALNNTVQDSVIRYKRMTGFETLWLPGTDHAGIATQNVVERKLAAEGKNRHEIGREAFIEKVWEWKDEYHATITKQLKKLGMSCDWDRERFTMDEGLSHAVKKVFHTLYNDGLVYRGKYIINWCPRCRTALSDEESEHQEIKGKLWYFKYPYAQGNGFLTIATTRPETMLGDTAVAVNPSDKRYADLIGTRLLLPLAKRKIPIIADDFVDKKFGTGAVKVTPAHDPNDNLMGQRHNLTPLVVMDESAHMTGEIPAKYVGLDRFTCRQQIVRDMEKEGLVEKVIDHPHAVGHCYRCHTMVEPYYSDQWFVSMKQLAEKALLAGKNDEIRFYPQKWKKVYIEWMENIRDWCISRQIWWGHRIPVWYCQRCSQMMISMQTPNACSSCQSDQLVQDEDVLDTWFSSWLWPFSTMGWPEKTPLLAKFYPTNTLITAPEILFFWVARMLMAGLYCTGKLPFTDIILHGTVRDKTGRKMSKSLGNSINPLDIVTQYGADALRFSLLMITAQGADVYIEKDTFDLGRNFANKLWNVSRFFLGTIEKPLTFSALPSFTKLESVDKWIVSRFHNVVKGITLAFQTYRLNEICHLLYDFIWHDFCDWYIEAQKVALYKNPNTEEGNDASKLCTYLLIGILKLLHPLMPYITEEIWGYLRTKITYPEVIDTELLINATYPIAEQRCIDLDYEQRFNLIQKIIVALRTIRSENNIPPDKKGKAIIIPSDTQEKDWLINYRQLIILFAKLEQLVIDPQAEKPGFAGQNVVQGIEVFLEFAGLIDRDVEIDRISKEINHLEKIAEQAKKRLQNTSFIEKAPAQIVENEKEKYNGILTNLDKLQNSLKGLKDQ